MSVMRFKRFTKVGVLKGIGRELLGRFFGRFNGNGKALALPPASASRCQFSLFTLSSKHPMPKPKGLKAGEPYRQAEIGKAKVGTRTTGRRGKS
jgi:hypothetical protein